MRAISVGIPTIGRDETLPSVLNSISFQADSVGEVIILDESVKPVTENFAVRQAMDLLSILGVDVIYVRDRNKKGIGSARYRLCEMSKYPFMLQLDDDVVMDPKCVSFLVQAICNPEIAWVVPTCVLIPGHLVTDGYRTDLVDKDDPEVLKWTEKYPWFTPYFRYNSSFCSVIPCAGTQAILLDVKKVLEKAGDMRKLGRLPREDTYLTSIIGPGLFCSDAVSYHFCHPGQEDRSNWGSSMFYRIHEVVMNNPGGFVESFGGGK
jgi:GT2 family glycosyltransferase